MVGRRNAGQTIRNKGQLHKLEQWVTDGGTQGDWGARRTCGLGGAFGRTESRLGRIGGTLRGAILLFKG